MGGENRRGNAKRFAPVRARLAAVVVGQPAAVPPIRQIRIWRLPISAFLFQLEGAVGPRWVFRQAHQHGLPATSLGRFTAASIWEERCGELCPRPLRQGGGRFRPVDSAAGRVEDEKTRVASSRSSPLSTSARIQLSLVRSWPVNSSKRLEQYRPRRCDAEGNGHGQRQAVSHALRQGAALIVGISVFVI